jgi:integrase
MEAAEHYLKWFRANRKSVTDTQSAIDAHILSALGGRHLASLKAPLIRAWHEKLASLPARVRTGRLGYQQKYRPAPKTEDGKRARRATANRILTVLKALLNKAFQDGLVSDNVEWRKVKPFPKVDSPRIRFLTDAEAVRLANACAPDLRSLVRGALLVGARYQELTSLRVRDVNIETAQVYIRPAKSDRARHVPVNAEGVALLKDLITGKIGDDLVFQKADGGAWGKNHHVRPLAAACKTAKVRPALAFLLAGL